MGVDVNSHEMYGWIVTRDRDYERDQDIADRLSLTSRVGVIGPGDIHPRVEQALHAGKGRKWRTLYDEPNDPVSERVVHEGRYVDLHTLGVVAASDVDDEAGFGPLRDLSQPDAGAADIQYRTGNRWQTL